MASRKIKIHDHVPSQPRHELLQVADMVAREKGIDQGEILAAMEQAIQKSAKAKYGFDQNIHVHIHRSTGSVSIEKHILVVEDDALEDSVTQITLSETREDPDLNHYNVGDVIILPLPPIDFGRVAAQSARQVITQKMRDAERLKMAEEYGERIGEIVSAIVKRVEFGNVILELGRGEGILKRDETIPRESFQSGDRIRALITDVNIQAKGPVVSVSRTNNRFMARLFEQEVPEIYDGVIEIKAIARDPGSRAKMAVFSVDSSLDPVGACVGMRGSRVQAVVSELQGEKVDIIPWSPVPATLVVNALAPAEATKVVLDERAHRVDVVVPEDQLSLAIGRRGQNVRLASQLTGWNIDILTEDQEAARRLEESQTLTNLFINALDVDEIIAQLLVTEGFETIEEIVEVELDEFSRIEGFDEDIATELKDRAKAHLANRDQEMKEEVHTLGVEKSLIELSGMQPKFLIKLAKNGIKTLDDFADLSGDEVLDILKKESMTLDQANALIMKAREHWFN